MSAKNCDRKNRWRCRTVAFRVPPAEADLLDMQVKTSGMLKQEFIIKRLMNEEIVIRPNIRIQKYLGSAEKPPSGQKKSTKPEQIEGRARKSVQKIQEYGIMKGGKTGVFT